MCKNFELNPGTMCIISGELNVKRHIYAKKMFLDFRLGLTWTRIRLFYYKQIASDEILKNFILTERKLTTPKRREILSNAT